MPCYKTCKKCYGKGDEQYNNCLECQINYTFLNESKNDTNCYDKCTFYYYFDNEKNKHHCTTENKCPENYPFIIRNKSKCIDDCKKDNIYTFAFNNECYIEGPSINIYITEIYQTEYPSINKETEIITEISKTEYLSINKDINMEICPKEFPYLNKETNTCIKECNANDFLTFKCSTDNENDEIKENNLIKIKNAISGHEIDDLLDGILDGGEDVTIYDKNTKYQLTSSSNQNENINEYKDISVIKLGECENVLKQVYKNISENDSLLIFKTDFNIEGYSTDIVEYEIYHPKTKEKLDLKYCEKNSIEIYQSASIDENELFKYNPNDPFYFDICSKFTTKNNIDITLFDRCEIFVNNNFSLCENDCIFSDYDYNLKKVICKCNIKVNFANIYDITKEKFNNNNCIQNLFNIKVMKCYNRLFDKDGLKKNIGSYILLVIIFLYNICLIYFIINGYNSILNIIKVVINYKKNKKKINEQITQQEPKKVKNNKIKNDIKKTKIKKPKNKRVIRKGNINSTKTNSLMRLNKSKNVNTLIIINNPNNVQNNKAKKDKKNKENKENKIDKKIKNKNYKRYKKNKKENKSNNKNIIKLNEYEINISQYNTALKYDKRNFFQYYWSLVKSNNILFFAFIPSNDYNSQTIKLCLFLFSFSQYYTISALFFNESSLHIIYEQNGIYNLIDQIPQIFYSSIISSVINLLIRKFSLTDKSVIKIKNDRNNESKVKEFFRCLKIKFILFFIISFLFLILFWYYIGCFCAVYENTQLFLIKDTLISFGFSLMYPFIFYLIPAILRIISLRNKKKYRQCIYNFSKVFQFIF